MKLLMTILSLVTISTTALTANQPRCEAYVHAASLSKVKASLTKVGFDFTGVSFEVKKQALVISNPEFEAWFVATSIQVDQKQYKERQEIIQFDKDCQLSEDLAWPQKNSFNN